MRVNKKNSRLPVALAAVAVMVILIGARLFVVGIVGIKGYRVASSSMEPTLRNGELIIVSRRHFANNEPQRGDVVVYEFPMDPDRDYLHRVVAIGGDTIEIKDKVLNVNGNVMDEPYVIHTNSEIYNSRISSRDNFGPVEVPDNKVFVMGDNRDYAYDSRDSGFIDNNAVKGKALYIYWSDDRTRIGSSIK